MATRAITAPTNLVAKRLSGAHVRLTWDPPSTGTRTYEQYEVWRNGIRLTANTGETAPNEPTTTYEDSRGLGAGTTYRYTVRGYHGDTGYGPMSEEAIVQSPPPREYTYGEQPAACVGDPPSTPAERDLGPVTNLTCSCVGGNHSLSWSPVAGAEGYWIEWAHYVDDGFWETLDFGDSGTPDTTWTQNPDNPFGPPTGVALTYRVKPVNETKVSYGNPWTSVQCGDCNG